VLGGEGCQGLNSLISWNSSGTNTIIDVQEHSISKSALARLEIPVLCSPIRTKQLLLVYASPRFYETASDRNSSQVSGFLVQKNELPTEHYAQGIPQSLLPNANEQQLLPPMFPIWPSSLTNPEHYSKAAPVTIPLPSTPLIKSNGMQLPVIQATPSPRKKLTDSDRRRMCQCHVDNPSLKQAELGGKKRVSNVLAPVINSCIAMFGVERRYEYIYSLLNLLRSYFQHRFQDPGSERKVSLSR
jgi:hypothetical protein